MSVERTPGSASLVDTLERVLDKGVVIEAWERRSLLGIDLTTVEARIVVASIDTYLKASERVGRVMLVSMPRRYGVAASSRSTAPADDDDDDDGGPEGSGSSGAPALLEYPVTPRRREPSRRDRTRRRQR